MNIGIIVPMEAELEELLKKVKYEEKDYKGIKVYEFDTKMGHCFTFLGKIGKTNTGFDLGYLASQIEFNHLFVLGVSASLVNDIMPLNVVLATKVCYYDVDITSDGKHQIGQMAGEPLYFECDKRILKISNFLNTTLTLRQGLVISGDSFATKKNITKELLSNFDNPLAIDMESASVGQIARRLNIPFNVIRGISDQLMDDIKAQDDVFTEFTSLSARRAASILLHILNEELTVDESEI